MAFSVILSEKKLKKPLDRLTVLCYIPIIRVTKGRFLTAVEPLKGNF